MLKLLVKKQLTEIFRAYLYDAKKNRARSKAATVGYIIFFVLLMVGVIGGMFTVLSLTMCRSMAEAGMSWFYFAIMGLMAICWVPSAACSPPIPASTCPRTMTRCSPSPFR